MLEHEMGRGHIEGGEWIKAKHIGPPCQAVPDNERFFPLPVHRRRCRSSVGRPTNSRGAT